ncbi:MAG: AFG1 family ATPase [Methylococcaceae bacterium NSP1-1]|jgi:cell division protein ZapE|nr:MAG: AFG1 family ATPase [Methylococcaceae bacterium NSP1-1]
MLKKFFQRAIPEQYPDLSGLLEKQYNYQVAQNHIQHDNAQLSALQHLQTLLDHILACVDYDRKTVTHKLLSSPPEKCKSLYIFGDVGRGKSMLMALFYEACPIKQKRRLHFNMFMLEVHAFIHEWRQKYNTDAISAMAKKIRASALVLCLDEFHVTDIADAMILERLFRKLFELGLIVVITSNRHPDDLYQGGLQREQFLNFIKLLQKDSKIIELVAIEDYRLMHLHALEATYYFPLDAHASEFVQQSYNEFTNFAAIQSGVLQVMGRKVVLTAVHGDIALTSFNELCVQPLGSADYLEIAREFSTLIMAGIPKLTAEKRNEAKRFITLIDALYEHKVKLICTAEVPVQELYTEGDGAFEFKRTVSRLIEMQSENYLESKHTEHL